MTADVPKTAAPQQEGPQYLRVTYNDIHVSHGRVCFTEDYVLTILDFDQQIVRASAQRIVDEFRPDLIIAIGGGGYVPARILVSFPSSQLCSQKIPTGCGSSSALVMFIAHR